MTATTGSCPVCKQINSYSAVSCIECGTRLPWADAIAAASKAAAQATAAPQPANAVTSPSTPTTATTPPQPPKTLECVVCGNESVQKVSAICQQGNWSSSTYGVTAGVGYAGSGSAVGIAPSFSGTNSSTMLASMLAPPQRPNPPVFREAVTVGCLQVLAVIGGLSVPGILIMMLSGGPGAGAMSVNLIFGIGVVFEAIRRTRLLRAKRATAQLAYESAVARWELALRNWERLFYCSKCDHVYNFETGQNEYANQMNLLL